MENDQGRNQFLLTVLGDEKLEKERATRHTLLCGVAEHMTIFSISILYTACFPRETQSTFPFFNFCLVNCILVNCQHLCLKLISRSHQLHTNFV